MCMYAESSPDDEDIRETYNFAPGYYGVVYRADTPDYGSEGGEDVQGEESTGRGEGDKQVQDEAASVKASGEKKGTTYKLQAMKWGLVPFWTKRNPDYGSLLRTINCRDDSLYEDRGMWTSMKRKKRCVVIAQGFYEWLKKNGGRERIPHFVKRKDGKLMCFAGLWDMVKYEGSDEKHYTYTIITTSPSKQTEFLHDRMPAILENGSEEMTRWLDPQKTQWSKELQSLLRPFEGELELYPVSKEVGKVGNNSPNFIVPVSSAENKNNIANFFSKAGPKGGPKMIKEAEKKPKEKEEPVDIHLVTSPTVKRTHGEMSGDQLVESPPSKSRKVAGASPSKAMSPKAKSAASNSTPHKKTRSAISNLTDKSPGKNKPKLAGAGEGSQKITAFFGK
ncbi:MAG: hypothetical protein M1814_005672 [Vezdaea aestivalis]|nr:MAG: hypothetical protein M1814_005672 [Vezdaea aestivalis]